jgi:hypothetical protein
MSSKVTIEDFKELNEDREKAFKELKNLESSKGVRGIYPAKRKLVEIYLPWRGEFYMGYIKVRENRRDDELDANIEFKNFVYWHDKGEDPRPIDLERYMRLREEGRLGSRIELFRVLSRGQRLRYYVHLEEEIEV